MVLVVVVVLNVLERMGSIYSDHCGLRRGILDLHLSEQLIHLEDYAKLDYPLDKYSHHNPSFLFSLIKYLLSPGSVVPCG